MVIKEIVQGDPEIGKAYKLQRLGGGKPLKFLITADRLKSLIQTGLYIIILSKSLISY